MMEVVHTEGIIPTELCERAQWVVWRFGEARPDGRHAKVPFSPRTETPAKSNDATTWGTYDMAVTAVEQGGWDGIGFMFSSDDLFLGIDIDGCRDPHTGTIAPWAWEIISIFATYTEVSPSGTGVKLFLRAQMQGREHTRTLKQGEKVEVYDSARFFTVTGKRLSVTPLSVAQRQATFDDWYGKFFARTSRGKKSQRVPLDFERLTDEKIIKHAQAGANGDKFSRLWSGDTSDYGSDESAADLGLCAMLAFYTQSPAQLDRLFRQSELYRSKWDERRGDTTYGALTVEKALSSVTASYTPKKRTEQRIPYVHPWQSRTETREKREDYLRQEATEAKERVRKHIEAGEATPLVIALPPGVGKTRKVAELGAEVNVAWIAERHDMIDSVAASHTYRHIQPCSEANCPDHKVHATLAAHGYNAWPLHRKNGCGYYQQHKQEGSAFYQVPHVATAYPKQHETAIVDELNLPNWIEDHQISGDQVQQARLGRAMHLYLAADSLLRAVSETLIEAQRADEYLHGKSLFDALNRNCNGRLRELVEAVAADASLMVPNPALPVDASSSEVFEMIRDNGPVILPQLVGALHAELAKWEQGNEWNSCLYVTHSALHILKPRRFSLDVGQVLPLTILDATADEELMRLLFGGPVRVERRDIIPPPNMRHIAVRTGKRYGKYSLTSGRGKEEYVERVAKEIRFLLARVDPDQAERNAERVGLITYSGCEDALGDKLGIPPHRRGHFWGVRGSNAFEDCTILIVVGTPTPNLGAIVEWARALYSDDPEPLDLTQECDEEGVMRYRDPRLRQLTDYLVKSELTQVAHRNRPLRHDGRIVITLTAGEIDFLPVTEEYRSLPNLTEQGITQAEAREASEPEQLEGAAAELRARGEKVVSRTLAKQAKVRLATAQAWLRRERERQSQMA